MTQTVVKHGPRLAISPDAEPQVAALLRQLMRQPWLVAGRDDDAIAAVRANATALRSVLTRLGWTLTIDRDLVRLVKTPPSRLGEWATHAPPPLTCAWVFLLAAAAEGLPHQVTIGQLVQAGKKAAAEAEVSVTGQRAERRAIVAAVRELADRGIIEETDGQIDSYMDNDDAPVLLTIFHTRLLYLIANFDPTTDATEDPSRWLTNVMREPDAGRRMRRRLVDDTCVHSLDLDEAEADWLSRRLRGDDGGPLAAAFGLAIERRAEGAAFVMPDDHFRWPNELGQVPFPGSGIVPHVALLLSDVVAADGEVEEAPGPGWRGMPRTDVLEALTEMAQRQTSGKGGWPAERVADPEGLLSDVERLLTGVGLLRTVDGWWWLSPVTGRWEAPPNTAFAPRTTTTDDHATPAVATLFDTEDDRREAI